VCQIGLHDLERDPAIVPQIPRDTDGRHSAARELPLYRVTSGKGFREPLGFR
jgi:hypothetical protein